MILKDMKELNVTIKGLVFLIIGGLLAVIISAILTLYAINTLFSTEIPIDIGTVFALTWLKIAVGGLIRGSK